jgi:hypothetical protein
MKAYTFTAYINDFCGSDCTNADVSFTYSAGRPGRNYMPNGDPGYPDEPAELDVFSVKVDGIDVGSQLTESQADHIEQQAHDYIEETVAAADEAYWSSRAAAMREEA